MVLVGVGIGVLGYHYLADFRMGFDALLNAFMILTGMGQSDSFAPMPPNLRVALRLFSGIMVVGQGRTFQVPKRLLTSPAPANDHRLLRHWR
jgi:hypothetical protein